MKHLQNTPWEQDGTHVYDSDEGIVAKCDTEEVARLVTSIPNLLSALQTIADSPGGTTGSALTLAVNTARAAIAKAKGD